MSRAASEDGPTRVRYRTVGLLFVMIAINYLDRSNLSVAATSLAEDLKFDPVRMGLIFSAFGWAYATLQIPGGWLVDRIGIRPLYAGACLCWSAATVLQGFAGSFLVLFGLRLLLGVFEAPSFPLCSRVVTLWFPDRERAGATAMYISGQFVGLAFLTPPLMLLQRSFGWQAVFVGTGLIGLLWAGIWYLIYRDPVHSRSVNAAELDFIRAGGGLVEIGRIGAGNQGVNWSDFGKVLGSRQLWGVYIGQYAVTATLWFFLTWFPTYLVRYRHIDFVSAGFFSAFPFLGAFGGVLCSGFLSDLLVRKGVSQTTARKVPIVAGLLLSSSIVGANYVEDPKLIILFLSIAFFGTGCASITWVIVSLLAPARLLGLTGGVFNFCGNLAAISIPIFIGLIVKNHGFAPALVLISGVGLMGALSYLFIVGRIERIEA